MRKWFFWALLMIVVMVVFAIRLLPDMLNKPPLINIPDLIIDEGDTLVIDLHDYSSDEKVSLLAYQKNSGPGELKGNLYTFSPTFQQSGKHSVSITAKDSKEQAGDATFKIEVREVNRNPVFSIPDQFVELGETVSIILDEFAKDPDLDTLNYSLEEGGGRIIGSNYTYKPELLRNGERVRILVSDGRGGETVASFNISDKLQSQVTLNGSQTTSSSNTRVAGEILGTPTATTAMTDTRPNTPPTIAVPSQRVAQGSSLTIDLASFISDRDGDKLSLELISGPGTLQGSVYNYTSALQERGQKLVVLEVSDGATSVRSNFTLDIITINNAPEVADIPESSLSQGETLTINLDEYFKDPDMDKLTYEVVSGPGKVENNNYIFQAQNTGYASTTVRAYDNKGGTVQKTFTINVSTLNSPPKLAIPARKIAEGENVTLNLSNYSSDPEGDRLSYTLVSGPGTVKGNIYSLETNYNSAGSYDVVIRVTDGKSAALESSFKLEVLDTNRPPSINLPSVTLAEGDSYALNLKDVSDDPDGDALSYSLVKGIGRIEGESYVLETGYDDYGFYAVTIGVSDSKGAQAVSTFDVLITDTNRGPEFTVPDQITMLTRTLRLDLREFSSDPDGDYLRYELLYGPGILTGSIYSFSPEELGTKTVMLKATDFKGGEATATFTITVR